MIRGNNVWNAFCVDAQPSVLTVWGAYPGLTSRFGREHAVGFLEMDVIGRGRQPDAQNAALADGSRDVALLAGPVGVMLVRHQMLGQLCRVADGGSHQTVSPQPLDDAIPVHVAVAETDRQQPRGNTMRRQEQGIRQLIDGSGHVAGDEAGPKPMWGAVGQHDLPQFQAGKLARLTPEAVPAIALVEILREQLRSQLGPFIDERPHALGILPDFVVLLADHGNDNLFGPAALAARESFVHDSLAGSSVERPFSHPLPWKEEG